MFEAGWLLLFLFLGLGALVVVACLWPAFRNTQHFQAVDEAHAFKEQAPAAPHSTKLVQLARAVKLNVKKALRYTGWWVAQLGQENIKEDANGLIPTFSVEEIGQIAASIAQKTERVKAIRSMPHYTRRQHQAFAMFFDRLKAAMSQPDDAP